MPNTRKLVVIGHGAAGLSAALAAAEEARSRSADVDITLLEKADESEAGGNTRWSPSYMRMVAPDCISPEFESEMQAASGGKADPGYFRTLATEAVGTVAWLQQHGVAFDIPVYYLSAGPARIQPVGGGKAFVEHLSRAVREAGVMIRYGCAATRLLVNAQRRLRGVALNAGGDSRAIEADAVILAAGGFQGNRAMLREHFGAATACMKLISPGTQFDTGDGIRMAAELGAAMSGDWKGMHAEPVDPRSLNPAPVVLVYPYGIVVDQNGERFFDEGAGLVHETWERFARDIQASRPGGKAFAILDSSLLSIEGYGRAIRSEVPPVSADTLEALATMIGVPPARLTRTVSQYNAAATGDAGRFDATRCDGLAASPQLKPPKSNWARPISRPPYLAYPLIGALAYTFGGIATNERAEVLSNGGIVEGLYAAGEVTGHFHRIAPNAVSMLRALVFGRISGRQAVGFLGRLDG